MGAAAIEGMNMSFRDAPTSAEVAAVAAEQKVRYQPHAPPHKAQAAAAGH